MEERLACNQSDVGSNPTLSTFTDLRGDMQDMTLYDFTYYLHRPLDNGREISVIPLTFGRARIIIGPKDRTVVDDEW